MKLQAPVLAAAFLTCHFTPVLQAITSVVPNRSTSAGTSGGDQTSEYLGALNRSESVTPGIYDDGVNSFLSARDGYGTGWSQAAGTQNTTITFDRDDGTSEYHGLRVTGSSRTFAVAELNGDTGDYLNSWSISETALSFRLEKPEPFQVSAAATFGGESAESPYAGAVLLRWTPLESSTSQYVALFGKFGDDFGPESGMISGTLLPGTYSFLAYASSSALASASDGTASHYIDSTLLFQFFLGSFAPNVPEPSPAPDLPPTLPLLGFATLGLLVLKLGQ